MAKEFTWNDVNTPGAMPRIYLEDYDKDLVYAPLPWQKLGLQETASGYGKLTSSYKIQFQGKVYRLYTLLYSNAGATYFTVKGVKIWVD